MALDCDFIGSEPNATNNIARFAQGRAVAGKDDTMSRLYAVESLYTLTGMNADHRLRVAPSQLLPVVARFALKIMGDTSDGKLTDLSKSVAAHDDWIEPCAKDLKASGKGLIMAGYRLPIECHLLVLAMNEALEAKNQTVEYREVPAATENDIVSLANDLKGGKVQTLVILGGNPAYNAPVDLDWAAAQERRKLSFGSVITRTRRRGARAGRRSGICPQRITWNPGEMRGPLNGIFVPIQPLIDPMFDGSTEIELLAMIAGQAKTKPYDIVRETFSHIAGTFENDWRKFLHDGFLAGSATEPANVQYNANLLQPLLAVLKAAPAAPSADKLDVVFYRDAKMDDGRHNNNGWLQELPDPVTKLTWDNAILVSPRTAREMGLSPKEEKPARRSAFTMKWWRFNWAGARCEGRFGSSPAWRILRLVWRWDTVAKRPGGLAAIRATAPTRSAQATRRILPRGRP